MNAVAQPIDLSLGSSWKDSAQNVLMSVDGRYTIVRYRAVGHLAESFTAFRRYGPPEHARWLPPVIVGAGRDIIDAYEACVRHSIAEARQ